MTDRPLRVVTIGAMFSSNRGAASMAQAVIDNLPEVVGACTFEVLTIYPDQDRSERPEGPVEIVPYRPLDLLLMLPLALLIAVVRSLGGTGRGLGWLPALRSLMEADVVVDLAGISFVDGRGFPLLVYNTLMTGIPLLVGARVVKCAQALGPFRSRTNRAAARLVLPRLEAVVARGELTRRHLTELELTNVREAADIAFTMKVPRGAAERADRLLADAIGEVPFVALVPSNVVRAYCEEHDIDYLALLRRFVDEVVSEEGTAVLAFPHAARRGRRSSRMDDIPLVQDLGDSIAAERFVSLGQGMPPAVLRALIARADALVTSRFHAMISALSVGTPVLVVGWSHKYEEALRDFGLEAWTMDYSSLDEANLLERFRALRDASAEIRQSIRAHLPAVIDRSWGNFAAIQQALGQGGQIR